jgi:hypothetical protein
MKWSAFAIALLLAGCASDQQVCSNFGFTPGTDGFANCMQNRYAQRQAAIQSMSAQQQSQQQQWYHEEMQSINNAQRANAARQPQTTNCYTYGNAIHCNSY